MTTKRKLIGRLVPCRCFRGEEEVISVLDYSHCSLQQVPKEIFSFERTLEELYLDANQIEELPKVRLQGSRACRWEQRGVFSYGVCVEINSAPPPWWQETGAISNQTFILLDWHAAVV